MGQRQFKLDQDLASTENECQATPAFSPGIITAVRATLLYQATPPFFLQDRFCNGNGANRDRLFHIASQLQTKDTPIEYWKFKLVSTGKVAVSTE